MMRVFTSRQSAARQVLLYLVVVATCAVLVFPIYWMFVTAVLPDGRVLLYPPHFLPTDLSLDSFARVLARTHVGRWYLNTTVVTLATIAFTIPMSSLAGYALSRFRTAGLSAIGYLLLVVRMLPSALLVIPLYVVFRQLGLLNQLGGLVIANTTFIVPFGAWMMKGFFDSIPPDIEDAAMIDGCTPLGALTRVVLPLSAPGLAATTIYCAILTWSEFLFASTLMSGEQRWTVTVGIASFMEQYAINWNDIMAASLIFVLPLIVLFLFLERYLVQGLTSGAVQ